MTTEQYVKPDREFCCFATQDGHGPTLHVIDIFHAAGSYGPYVAGMMAMCGASTTTEVPTDGVPSSDVCPECFAEAGIWLDKVDPNAPEPESAGRDCPSCGALNYPLGALGPLMHYTCRACGQSYNHRA